MNRKTVFDALQDAEGQESLFRQADQVRREQVGDVAQLRGVVHFSNHCRCNDLYCGLMHDNDQCQRFRMTEDQIVDTALAIADAGLRTVVLQSGEDLHFTRAMFCSIIERILEKADVAITLSLGKRSREDMVAFRSAGAERYLMKHETMNPALYSRMRSGLKLDDRLRLINMLREVGFQVGVGNIVGLPGQTLEDLCEDILFFQDFQPDMINIGPFIPHAQTPLKDTPTADMELMLRVFALTRIVTGNTHMAAANTVATLDPDNGQFRALTKGGANVIMPNCNPFLESKTDKIEYEFQITTHKRYVSVNEARNVLERAGRTEGVTKGHSLKLQGEAL
ncbi:[FeFe] hydrogenase H-cluster radical SAM maturase HydE [Pseudodesulfovibrio nedwellii]|uniref:[FeFe] hydrogenase H-cluster radical SAM maturase HydE n=1 Tax=Pseudodesulfovibrio nedwellii TaxID=2973072 RepID=A0ABM8B065_9BACT|nr:[FeFe] hydrogenase H-cluster radical SAM maturase HydE [Pseudodesulfovibrio nedwellii]BDQ37082.1 [FeFe] hydrogenase H-cluster radical SAM maturase HydE [Pseudodesulfovibrio nedwellii]